MSGTGKSSVIRALAAHGYKAVDTDDGWREPLPDGRQQWREDAIDELLATEDADVLFVAGCEENQVRFYPRFDLIILLSAPAGILVERRLRWNCQPRSAREILMPDDASATQDPAELTERVKAALESGDLDAISELLDPNVRWGAPEGPNDADCHNRGQVIAWWAGARASGARAVVTEVTTGAGTLLVGLEVTGTQAARDAGGAERRWQVLTVRGDRIADIRGFDDRAAAAARAGVPA